MRCVTMLVPVAAIKKQTCADLEVRSKKREGYAALFRENQIWRVALQPQSKDARIYE